MDVDQYSAAGHILTSAIKRVDVGVYSAIAQLKAGKFLGGSDLNFNLKNGGMGVGKINPAVNPADVAAMNALKAKIIAGTVKVPTSLSMGTRRRGAGSTRPSCRRHRRRIAR